MGINVMARKRIEATGNTRAEADAQLDKKRDEIWDKFPDTPFGHIVEFGNFEVGYKLIQEYGDD